MDDSQRELDDVVQLQRKLSELQLEVDGLRRAEEVHRREAALAGIERDLTVALTSVRDTEQGLRLCLEAAIQASGMDCGGIYVLDPETGGFELTVHRGLSSSFIEMVRNVPPESGQVSRIMKGRPLYGSIDDLPPPDGDASSVESLQGLACIPALHDGQVVGCMNIGTHSGSRVPRFTRTVLESIAAHVGDVISRLHSETVLRRTDARYRATFEQAAVGIAHVSPEGRFLSVNARMCEILGRREGEIVGFSHEDITHPQDREADRASIQQMLDGEIGSFAREKRYQRKDGSVVWGRTTVSLVRGERGEPRNFIAVVQDITEWKRAQEAEQAHRRELAALGRTAMELVQFPPDGDIWSFIAERTAELAGGSVIVAVTELDETHETFDIRALAGLDDDETHLVLATLGCDPTMLRVTPERNLLESLTGSSLVPVQESLVELLSGQLDEKRARELEKALDLEVTWGMGLERGGSLFGTVTILARRDQPAPNRGAVEAFVGQVTVALERRRAEEEKNLLEQQLLHSQKMEALGALAGGIAHDFGNQLHGIIGFANLLKKRSEPGDPVREAAEVIEDSGKRAHQLTKQLLDFAHKGQMQSAPVNLHEIVIRVASLLDRTIDKRIEVHQELGAESSFVTGDPSQLEQVVMNLAVNARDAMPDGGRLVFATRTASLDAEFCRLHPEIRRGRHLLVTVSDTGVGMNEDVRQRIFEPFFTTKAQGKGTGMGLAMVYGIVKQHDGTVTVESREGEGTTFTVYLPSAMPSAEMEIPEEIAEPWTGSATVLAVDDEDNVRKTLVSMLESLGLDVVTAQSGTEAIEIFRERSSAIDLVVLDMTMPSMDGRTCMRELLEIAPDALVVLSTAHDLRRIESTLAREGMAAYIQKPFVLDSLSILLARLL